MTKSPDKPAEALRADRLAMLQEIAKDLENEVVFPVNFDVTVKMGAVLREADASPSRVARFLEKDPLVVLKLFKAAHRRRDRLGSASPVLSTDEALALLGMGEVRRIVGDCAREQLSRSRELAAFEEEAYFIWQHSLRTAAIARVLAARLTRVNPLEAFLAGLVHDLGAFYLLDRTRLYPELLERPKTVVYLVAQWHESVNTILLDSLGLPAELIEGVRDHEEPRPPVENPRTLNDVIYLANRFAGGLTELHFQDVQVPSEPVELLLPKFAELRPEWEGACTALLDLS
ncbi:HDOD domain-containing protein [Chitinilyticum piscinae]|uniref:HDOD domain-containing protein n=1 Tax=Chitinilyticum piscinae TaxID=2866724 RepID=A0A8J7FK00_9NEIS|nr:HDOD domain-containing protein [Chitinilyticum piscinae]MBE9608144.1 HDOD domain-containing protein [Chitinilyticum piscinae]